MDVTLQMRSCRLTAWILNRMTVVLIRDPQRNTGQGRLREDGGRDWSFAPRVKEGLAISEAAGRRQPGPLEPWRIAAL